MCQEGRIVQPDSRFPLLRDTAFEGEKFVKGSHRGFSSRIARFMTARTVRNEKEKKCAVPDCLDEKSVLISRPHETDMTEPSNGTQPRKIKVSHGVITVG